MHGHLPRPGDPEPSSNQGRRRHGIIRPERCATAATMATWPASGMIGQGADSHRARPAPFRGDLAEEPNGLHGHRPPPSNQTSYERLLGRLRKCPQNHSPQLTHSDCAASCAGSRHALRADRPLEINETGSVTTRAEAITERTFAQVKGVVRGGVEPPTFRFSGAFPPWLHVAGRGLMGDLAAQTVAGCRLMWPDICGRWLPVWLPESTEGAAAAAWRLIAAWQVIGTVQVAHHRTWKPRWQRR
jgi:hypothetical protein